MKIQQPTTAHSSSADTLHEQVSAESGGEIQPPASPQAMPVSAALAALPSRPASTFAGRAASHAPNAEPAPPQPPRSATATQSTARGLVARAGSALASGTQHATAAVSQAASDLWSLSDLRTMLQVHASDPAFLQLVRHADPEQLAPQSLAHFRAATTQLRNAVTQAPGLEKRFRHQLLGDITAVEKALRPLEQGVPVTRRALTALSNLVNFWPLIVPSPLMANQAKTFAYSLSAATKGVVAMSMASLRPTADGLPFPIIGGGQLGRDANEMYLYAYLLNGAFLGFEITKKTHNDAARHQAEAIENNLGFAAAASTACAALMLTPFIWNSISTLCNRVYSQASHISASAAQSLGFQDRAQRLRAGVSPGEISMELRAQLDEIVAALLNGRDAFKQARDNFGSSHGHELTSTLNGQCTHLLETVDRCCKRLSGALQHDQHQPASIPPPLHNNDFSSKLSLALLGAGVTGLVIYLIQPDRIGTVDTLADTAVVTAVMLQSAFNKNTNRQGSMERFKSMCGGSMVVAMALGADKLSKTLADRSLIEASSASPYYAAAVMTLMAMTMPGPVANGAELAMNWSGRQIGRLFAGPDGTPLATTLPSSPEELQETTHRTLRYLLQLSPAHRQIYEEQTVADAALQAIQDAGAAAQPRASSVTITEVEDGTGAATGPRVPTEAGGTMEHGTVRDAGTHAPGGSNRGIGDEIEEQSDATVSASANNAGSVRAYEPGDTTAGHPSDHH
ncbi:type III secretion system effector protein [Xanthomonas prunicola]|uniref:XopX family type III secretion system effector n=1 Tax=Xanthomonas prunicola TaxID=2053930 RepID=UPI0021B3BEE1|nr:XopX family type III secretion system effector [Xanthomonas prunicola]UXA70504.1 type III secretion system effector protein [Xanthomonas prunicola]